jgi:di/tricarboxylate transporter
MVMVMVMVMVPVMALALVMPMAFASLLGGTCTLIGTSTNIAGNNFLVSKGYESISMFEFLPIGLTLLGFTTLFFIIFGEKLFKHLNVNEDQEETESLYNRKYFSDFVLLANNKLIGKNGKYLTQEGVEFICVENENGEQSKDSEKAFQQGDKIYIQGSSENIKKIYNNFNLDKFHTHENLSDSKLIEMMVLPTSTLVDSTLKESNFFKQTGLKVISIFRKNYKYEKSLKEMHVRVGDILICEGAEEDLDKIIYNNDFIVLNHKKKSEFPRLQKGFLILGIFFLAIVAAALEILPISIALLLAIMLMIALNIIPTQEVFSSVDWRLIILIGGMSAFGVAVTKTGIDTALASFLLENFASINALLLMFIFMVLTVLLTQPMSNAAAALVMLPIGLQTANSFGIDPRGFAISIILSASISMITPFEPASLLVFKPGGYKVKDFFRIGGFLTICCLFIILFMVNQMYLH